jgi:hypothetical protein
MKGCMVFLRRSSSFVCLCVCLTGCVMPSNDRVTSEEQANHIEECIQRLKIGTPRIVIEDLLISNQVEHSWISTKHQLYATVRNISTEKHSIVQKNISIVFTFDTQNKLLQTKSETLYTGP